MTVGPDTIDQLSQVVSHAIAPSFVLGATISLVATLSSRIEVVLGRIRGLNAIAEDDFDRVHLKQDIVRLKRRLKLLHRALLFSSASGFATTLLMIVSFAMALFGFQHLWAAVTLFIVSVALLSAVIVTIGLDGVISLHRYDQF